MQTIQNYNKRKFEVVFVTQEQNLRQVFAEFLKLSKFTNYFYQYTILALHSANSKKDFNGFDEFSIFGGKQSVSSFTKDIVRVRSEDPMIKLSSFCVDCHSKQDSNLKTYFVNDPLLLVYVKSVYRTNKSAT
jgi:hypothetical protein